MKWWPWPTRPDQAEFDAVEERVRDLEDRAAVVEQHVREADPWAARVLDTLHPRKPHAR